MVPLKISTPHRGITVSPAIAHSTISPTRHYFNHSNNNDPLESQLPTSSKSLNESRILLIIINHAAARITLLMISSFPLLFSFTLVPPNPPPAHTRITHETRKKPSLAGQQQPAGAEQLGQVPAGLGPGQHAQRRWSRRPGLESAEPEQVVGGGQPEEPDQVEPGRRPAARGHPQLRDDLRSGRQRRDGQPEQQ